MRMPANRIPPSGGSSSPTRLALLGDVLSESGELLRDHWLVIEGELISGISTHPPDGATRVDASGKLILPGLIDAHVHCRSDPEEGLTATTSAAAAGGVTTVIDMPFDAPARPVRTLTTLEAKIAAVNAEAVVDVGLYATFAPDGPLDEIAGLAGGGACGFKVSTYGVDPLRFPRIPDGRLVEAFAEIALTGLPVAAHQENQEIVDYGIAKLRSDGRVRGIDHARSRPPVSETEAAGRLLEFAHWTGAHLHMVHGTVPRTFDLIAWHRSTGTSVSGETCIQYLILSEAELERQGGRAKCNPPLRTEADAEALWSYLGDGRIDIVTSDHSPYGLERKLTADIFDASPGLPGVATLVPLLYSEGVARGRISLTRFVELLSSRPARIFGLEHKGRLAPGAHADVVIFDPDASSVIDDATLPYRVGWSPFHGREVKGRVEATYVRGRCVYRDGVIVGKPGDGRFVSPSRPL